MTEDSERQTPYIGEISDAGLNLVDLSLDDVAEPQWVSAEDRRGNGFPFNAVRVHAIAGRVDVTGLGEYTFRSNDGHTEIVWDGEDISVRRAGVTTIISPNTVTVMSDNNHATYPFRTDTQSNGMAAYYSGLGVTVLRSYPTVPGSYEITARLAGDLELSIRSSVDSPEPPSIRVFRITRNIY